MATKHVADVTLDTRGVLCPMPVIKARMAMDKMQAGQVLQLLASDPGAKADVPSWARMAGHRLLGSEEENKTFVFWVQKGGDKP